MTERELIATARLEATQKGGLLFRNPAGHAWQGEIVSQGPDRMTLRNPRRVVYGLHNGASDMIGIMPIHITPAMVGHTIGALWCVELKTQKDHLHANQKRFLENMAARGAICQVVQERKSGLWTTHFI